MKHSFDGSWQPHPRLRGDEHDVYVEECAECGLTVTNPDDIAPVSELPDAKVTALSDEWLQMMGLPRTCEEQIVLEVLRS